MYRTGRRCGMRDGTGRRIHILPKYRNERSRRHAYDHRSGT